MATKDQDTTKNSDDNAEKKSKITSHQMVTQIISMIDKDPLCEISGGVPFKYDIRLLAEPNGSDVSPILVEPNGQCTRIATPHFTRLILNHIRVKVDKGWPVTDRVCAEAITQWIAVNFETAINSKTIAQLSFKSQDNLCWQKIAVDPKQMPTPVWSEILERISCPDEFEAFLGSIFIGESDRSQFLWVFGTGANGKSRILAFLHNLIKLAASPQAAPTQQTERWFKAGLVGKRLVTFGDCSNTKFVSSDLFKSLTGDDIHSVERKGKDLVNEVLTPKFLFMSNDKPNIVGDQAGRRRALVVEIDALSVEEISPSIYDENLMGEAQGVIWRCLAAYERMTKHHSKIQISELMKQGIQEAVEANDEYFQVTLNKFYEIKPQSDRKDWVRASEVLRTFMDEGMSRREYSGLKKFLNTRGIEVVNVRIDGRQEKLYSGLVSSKDSAMSVEVKPGATGASVTDAF